MILQYNTIRVSNRKPRKKPCKISNFPSKCKDTHHKKLRRGKVGTGEIR